LGLVAVVRPHHLALCLCCSPRARLPLTSPVSLGQATDDAAPIEPAPTEMPYSVSRAVQQRAKAPDRLAPAQLRPGDASRASMAWPPNAPAALAFARLPTTPARTTPKRRAGCHRRHAVRAVRAASKARAQAGHRLLPRPAAHGLPRRVVEDLAGGRPRRQRRQPGPFDSVHVLATHASGQGLPRCTGAVGVLRLGGATHR
jgi:hypothetical protein